VVFSQTPQPCETPVQWEAVFHRFDQLRGFFERGRFSYDNVRNRTAENIVTQNPNGTFTQVRWIINLWDVTPAMRYDVNLTTQVCTKSFQNTSFRLYAIGQNDTFLGAEILGSSAILGGYVDATRWQQNHPNGTDHNTVTSRGCIPLRRERSDNTTVPNNVFQEHWYNVVIGIPNPNVFIPPPQCFV